MKSKWIKCSDRLPPKARIVLITDGNQVGLGFMGLHGAKRSKSHPDFYRPVSMDYLRGIIAWQYLPKPLRTRIKNGSNTGKSE